MRRCFMVFCGVASLMAAAALAQSTDELSQKQLKAIGEGRGLYLTYCTGCHGADARGAVTGTGHGTPDLTLIATRDGRFDRIHVVEHVGGHFSDCNTEMPCWSKVLARRRPGSQGIADGKVVTLVDYLQFVQQPESALLTKQ